MTQKHTQSDHTGQQNKVTPRDLHTSFIEPPYSEQAEAAVCGAILVYPDMYGKIADFLTGEDFYILRHKYIWEAFGRLLKRSDVIDLLTVAEELQNMGWLNEIGEAYLTHLVNVTPTSLHAEFYGRIVLRASVRRRLMQVADEIKMLAVNEELELGSIIFQAAEKVEKVATQARANQQHLVHVQETIQEEWALLDDLMAGKAVQKSCVTSGLKDLDTILGGGFERKKSTIIAARPHMGKSSLLYNIALAAGKEATRIAMFTVEIDQNEMVKQLIAIEMAIEYEKIKNGRLIPAEYSRFVDKAGLISSFRLFVDGSKSVTPQDIYARVRKMHETGGVDLVLIDYFQRLKGWKKEHTDERLRYNDISASLPVIANDFNCAVVTGVQVKREVENRQDKRPLMSDLKGTGNLEEDADVIIFIYRDAVYNDATEFPNQADLIVAKNRQTGIIGTVSTYFDKPIRRFMNSSERFIDLGGL